MSDTDRKAMEAIDPTLDIEALDLDLGEPTELELSLAASADARLVDIRRARWTGLRFAALVLLVLFVHAAIIAAFLWRDANTKMQVAAIEETPVEVIVEKPEPPPPPPQKPPPPKPPEPPKPKEELEKPALSAPRAPNEQELQTEKTQPKTSVPKAATPPSEGQVQPKASVAPPKEAAPDESKEDAAKAPDETKPDAEALDKASPKSVKPPTPKPPKTKAAKAAPKTNQKTKDLFASLSGSDALPNMTFAKPSARTKIYGGTEDVRWMSIVEAALEAKVQKLPQTAHWHDGGHVVVFFHVDVSGRVIAKEIVVKSGYPDIDAIAMRALASAAPFPPPPPGLERGLYWASTFDGVVPKLTISKR